MNKELPRWIVSRIKGSRAEQIAIVRAKDAASAVAAVAREAEGANGSRVHQAAGGAAWLGTPPAR